MIKKDGMKALSRTEIDDLKSWLEKKECNLPPEITDGLTRMLAVYSNLVQSAARAKRTLVQLRQSMGFTPKSERGIQDQGLCVSGDRLQLPPELSNLEENAWNPEQKAHYEAIKGKRDELRVQKSEYDRKLRELKGRPKFISTQLDLGLARPNEMLFSFPLAAREETEGKRQVDRMKEFEKTTGLHVSHDRPKRVDVKLVVTEITYKVETVTDPVTGKSVRASMAEDGPEGFQLTWGAVSNLIKMHVGFAIPINRIMLMIGQPEFSSSKICRVLQYVAMNLVVIYLYLSEELSDVGVLAGDDTTTKVLEAESTGKLDDICDEIDAHLGWTQPRANGKGDKKALNVSLIVGKPGRDPRSTIRFFRTHVGSVGNLLTKILESRSPKAGAVIFQGDLSTANLPIPALREKFRLAVAGCGAHARRPFWRYRKDDESFCYFMLRGFLMLTEIENLIDARGRTRENVLKLRGRYGRWIWGAMRNRCIAATTGHVPSPGTYPRGITPNIWPPNTELNKAGMYVINHFEELTLYLAHPELEYTNNGRERALRIEKCMLSSSKFRKTKRGRVTLDILRTINATCTAANVDLTDYLPFVFKNADQIHEHPENFTPYAFARSREQEQPGANPVVTTIAL